MSNAVIVSTARTPLAKSWKGAFNMTHGATLAGHVIKAAVERAGVDAGEVEDVLLGCAICTSVGYLASLASGKPDARPA